MIPKKIHYCWFGSTQIPKFNQRCIDSWLEYMPDFEIILWNEDKFNVNSTSFTKEAYEAKKYAFVADYVRIYALLTEGGIYLDTDVEIIQPLDIFLNCDAFGGFETRDVLQTGVIGTVASGVFISKVYNYYYGRTFLLENGQLDQTPNSKIITKLLLKDGLQLDNTHQKLSSIEVFPMEYFCPIDQGTREIVINDNTYAIHYLSGSWLPFKARFIRAFKSYIGGVFGFKLISIFRKLIVNR